MQYSYLSSPLATLVELDKAPASARTLAGIVYNHWRQMPPDSRPKLYLHGLSLGSYGPEQALSLLALINHPIDGALWSGPLPKDQTQIELCPAHQVYCRCSQIPFVIFYSALHTIYQGRSEKLTFLGLIGYPI